MYYSYARVKNEDRSIYADAITSGYVTYEIEGKQEDKNMQVLYEVIVVDKYGDIIFEDKIVATDKTDAIFKLEVYEVIRGQYNSLDEVTILTLPLGAVKVTGLK